MLARRVSKYYLAHFVRSACSQFVQNEATFSFIETPSRSDWTQFSFESAIRKYRIRLSVSLSFFVSYRGAKFFIISINRCGRSFVCGSCKRINIIFSPIMCLLYMFFAHLLHNNEPTVGSSCLYGPYFNCRRGLTLRRDGESSSRLKYMVAPRSCENRNQLLRNALPPAVLRSCTQLLS